MSCERLHDAAYALATRKWKRQMEQFFMLELPGSCMLMFMAIALRNWVAAGSQPALSRFSILLPVLAAGVFCCVWAWRLPPVRPRRRCTATLAMLQSLHDRRQHTANRLRTQLIEVQLSDDLASRKIPMSTQEEF